MPDGLCDLLGLPLLALSAKFLSWMLLLLRLDVKGLLVIWLLTGGLVPCHLVAVLRALTGCSFIALFRAGHCCEGGARG